MNKTRKAGIIEQKKLEVWCKAVQQAKLMGQKPPDRPHTPLLDQLKVFYEGGPAPSGLNNNE